MEQVIVNHVDGTTTQLRSATNVSSITKMQQHVEMLGGDTVEISVASAKRLTFGIGDSITVIGRDYTLNTPPREHKLGERSFTYDLTFEGVQYDLLRATYSVNVSTTDNQIQDLAGDSLTGDLKMFLDVLISNANRVFDGQWLLGDYPLATETKTLTFSETDNCLSVLQSLCSEENFNTEFRIDIATSGVRTLHVGATGSHFAYTFEYGRGKGLYELIRERVDSTNIVTRLYAYGSNKNINTRKYRAFRLCLPHRNKGNSYEESNTAMARYGVWEETKVFDDIYPNRTGTVSGLGDDELTFVDSSMDFDLNAKDGEGNTLYLLAGTTAKVHFNTGKLAGYEFEVVDYNHSTKTYKLRPFTDENDYTFPSKDAAAFQIAEGDTYVLLDIYLPQSYVDAAESRLVTAAVQYLNKHKDPNVMYGLSVDPAFLKSVVGSEVQANIFWVGDYIPVKDDDMGVDKSIRIKGFTRDLLNEYDYTLTIADQTVTVSTITRVVGGLKGLDKIVRINNLNDPARARRNYLNAQEVLGMVFDQEGDFYTDKIKPLSIDTTMLSVGAKYSQFGMMGTAFQPNYGGAKNRVVYAGGTLTHYAILDGSNSPRTWAIGDGDVVLASDGAYYIYAKCQKDGASGSILFSTAQMLADDDPGFYHFLIGVINSAGADDERAIALMYGFTTINGRFIKTGRVQSADGLTYFDLDTGTIQGNIRFQGGKTVGEVVAEEVEGLGIEVLHTNLLINSNVLGRYTPENGVALAKNGEWINFNKTGSGNLGVYADVDVKPSTTYTVSFDARNMAGAVQLGIGGKGSTWYKYVNKAAVVNGVRNVFTITTDAAELSIRFFLMTHSTSATGGCDFKDVLIHEGDSTEWVPNPADLYGENLLPHITKWGQLSLVGATHAASLTRVSTPNFIDIPFDRFTVSRVNDSYRIAIAFYSSSEEYITPAGGANTWINTYPSTYLAPADAKYVKYVISRVDSGQIRVADIKDAGIKVEKGTVATPYGHPVINEKEAMEEAMAAAFLKQALSNDTVIQGGLLSSTLIKVGAQQSGANWVEKAGINGGGSGDSTPRLYAGGTLQQAIARAQGLGTGAKFVVTEGGKVYAIDVELMGSLATQASGARIMLDDNENALKIFDASGAVKTIMSAGTMPAASSIIQAKNVTLAASLSASAAEYDGSPTSGNSQTRESGNLVLPSTSAEYMVETPSLSGTVTLKMTQRYGAAAAYIQCRLVSTSGHPAISVYSTNLYLSETGTTTIPIAQARKTIQNVKPGTWKLRLHVWASTTLAGSEATVSASTSGNLVGKADVDTSRIYQDGIFLVKNSLNYIALNPAGIVERTQTPPDRPGVLMSGSVRGTGTAISTWGPKKGAVAKGSGTGIYTIGHSIGHTDYHVVITPHVSSRQGVVGTKNTGSVTVYIENYAGNRYDVPFDFIIVGNNFP